MPILHNALYVYTISVQVESNLEALNCIYETGDYKNVEESYVLFGKVIFFRKQVIYG